jgi:3-deoxy-D-manno-octulosonic acid (KDO) 8-phosphate synthase
MRRSYRPSPGGAKFSKLHSATLRYVWKIQSTRCHDKSEICVLTRGTVYYFDNLSVKDIARLTAKKSRQVSDILYNAKKSLQAIITKGGIKYEILRPDTK